MGGSHAAVLRTAALGLVGFAALGAAVSTGHGTHDGFALAVAGGFCLGIAAALGFSELRADGRAEAPALAAGAPGAPPGRASGANGHHRPLEEPEGTAIARATVAAVAHDMSNPLASLRSNLEWLRDALDTGRLRLEAPEEQAEAREVLRDAREAAERLRADVGALRAAGRGEETPPAG